ncbi:MAG: tetratricopeptide repeat protein [Candidatus Glassbacteria bacterium]|nr:tetratricopeptide repeat protein [Candidatus Glassbacteria bacterium]
MRKLLIFMAVSCVWMFTVASSPVVTGARVRLSAKKYESAIKVLEKNKDKYADDPELFYYLGRAYAGIANWDKAGENFNKALDLEPKRKLVKEIDKWRDYYWAQFIRDAQALLDQQRYPEAINKFRIANRVNSDRKESHANLGVAMLSQAEAFQEAQPPQPDSARLYFDGAIESLQRAIELDPEDEQFVKNLGQAYIMADRYDEAIEVYEAYLEENPFDITAKKRLVTIFMSMQDFESAGMLYEELFEDAGAEMTEADYFNAGSCYYQMWVSETRNKAEGEKDSEQATHYLERAAEAYEYVMDDNPSDCEAGEQLYYSYINLENWAQVVETIETMLDNGCERTYITLSNLGVGYSKIGNQQKAIEVFKEAQENKPADEQSQ